MQRGTMRRYLRLLPILYAALLAATPARAGDIKCDASAGPQQSGITISLDPTTTGQPRGGQFRIIVDSRTQSLKDIELMACFRWSGAGDADFVRSPDVQLVSFVSNDNSG